MQCQITTCPDRVEQANPIRHISTHDLLVPYNQGVLLFQALRLACRDTDGCHQHVRPVTLNWDTVIHFFQRNLRADAKS